MFFWKANRASNHNPQEVYHYRYILRGHYAFRMFLCMFLPYGYIYFLPITKFICLSSNDEDESGVDRKASEVSYMTA